MMIERKHKRQRIERLKPAKLVNVEEQADAGLFRWLEHAARIVTMECKR